MIPLPSDLQQLLQKFESIAEPETALRVRNAFQTLFSDAMTRLDDGTIFVATGDIDAMWIRDSTWQLRPLLAATGSTGDSEAIIGAVSQRQAEYLLIDPYANAFNIAENGMRWHKDFADQSDWVFERKYELDSIAAFFDLALRLYRVAGYSAHLNELFWRASEACLNLLEREQRHDPTSYRFVRPGNPSHDQLSHEGFGAPFAETGMVWSGFRPSDDGCELPFLIPANAHLTVTLDWLQQAANDFDRADLAERSRALAEAVCNGLAKHGLIGQASTARFAYECDGLGNALAWDDPNVPSLLAMPYLGWCSTIDPLYQRTRNWILSSQNPMYLQGTHASGLTSVHTPPQNVWPLAIAVQGLTAKTMDEATECLALLESIDGGTGRNHESVNVNDPSDFTRPWFSWADMTYAHLALKVHGLSQAAD
jgi:hypothetical protein